MPDKARFFAYTTWVLMISLAMIVFSSQFSIYVNNPGWPGLVALLGFGLLWLNFSYFSIKRFVRKSPEPSNMPYLLAFFIFLPPGAWIVFVNNEAGRSAFILFIVIAFACGLGAYYGNKTGSRERQAWLESDSTT